MVQTIIVVVITGISAALIGALIAIKFERNAIQRLQQQHQAWERAQESHQQNWQQQQERNIAEVEKRLAARVQQVQEEWQKWVAIDAERIKNLKKQHEDAEVAEHLKRELARLPRVEDTPLLHDVSNPNQHSLNGWQPPRLSDTDLSERDLSHRYLGQADLRNARLIKTNFFMSDLSGAILTGADLSGADLSGANLSGADLRGALLTNANLHVADLQDAILFGTNLLKARQLTSQQLYTALYDSSTQIDPAINITHPRLARVAPAQSNNEAEENATDVELTSAHPTPEEQPPSFMEAQETPLPESSIDREKPAFLAALETPHPTLLPDLELFKLEEEAHFSLPLALSDSLLDLKVTDLLVDTPENNHTAESGTPTPR